MLQGLLQHILKHLRVHGLVHLPPPHVVRALGPGFKFGESVDKELLAAGVLGKHDPAAIYKGILDHETRVNDLERTRTAGAAFRRARSVSSNEELRALALENARAENVQHRARKEHAQHRGSCSKRNSTAGSPLRMSAMPAT